MKEEKTNINKNNVTIPKIKEDRKELQQLIIQLTDQKTEDRFSDKSLDRENEKIKLLNGNEITIGEIKRTIAERTKNYSPVFTHETEFYIEMYRLNNWNIEDAKKYIKKPVVGKYTNEIIYHRFSDGILPMLQKLNPYIGNSWIREYKHFQWLTDEAKNKVETFINESVEVMKTCDTWYEFRVKYFVLYKIPFQTDAFVDTNKMIDEQISNRSF